LPLIRCRLSDDDDGRATVRRDVDRGDAFGCGDVDRLQPSRFPSFAIGLRSAVRCGAVPDDLEEITLLLFETAALSNCLCGIFRLGFSVDLGGRPNLSKNKRHRERIAVAHEVDRPAVG